MRSLRPLFSQASLLTLVLTGTAGAEANNEPWYIQTLRGQPTAASTRQAVYVVASRGDRFAVFEDQIDPAGCHYRWRLVVLVPDTALPPECASGQKVIGNTICARIRPSRLRSTFERTGTNDLCTKGKPERAPLTAKQSGHRLRQARAITVAKLRPVLRQRLVRERMSRAPAPAMRPFPLRSGPDTISIETKIRTSLASSYAHEQVILAVRNGAFQQIWLRPLHKGGYAPAKSHAVLGAVVSADQHHGLVVLLSAERLVLTYLNIQSGFSAPSGPSRFPGPTPVP
jgi:hypothetical protein